MRCTVVRSPKKQLGFMAKTQKIKSLFGKVSSIPNPPKPVGVSILKEVDYQTDVFCDTIFQKKLAKPVFGRSSTNMWRKRICTLNSTDWANPHTKSRSQRMYIELHRVGEITTRNQPRSPRRRVYMYTPQSGFGLDVAVISTSQSGDCAVSVASGRV